MPLLDQRIWSVALRQCFNRKINPTQSQVRKSEGVVFILERNNFSIGGHLQCLALPFMLSHPLSGPEIQALLVMLA